MATQSSLWIPNETTAMTTDVVTSLAMTAQTQTADAPLLNSEASTSSKRSNWEEENRSAANISLRSTSIGPEGHAGERNRFGAATTSTEMPKTSIDTLSDASSNLASTIVVPVSQRSSQEVHLWERYTVATAPTLRVRMPPLLACVQPPSQPQIPPFLRSLALICGQIPPFLTLQPCNSL